MRSIFIGVVAILAMASGAAAQRGAPGNSTVSGLEVRGNVHFNRTEITPVDDAWEARKAYGLGVEYVVRNVGIGLYGHADGRRGPTLSDTTAYFLSAEANYFLPLGGPELSLYVGGHASLGAFDRTWFDDPYMPDFPNSMDALGYQVGVRYKPFPFAGLDAQWRHQSRDVWNAQEGFLERSQLLIGVVIF